MLLASGQVVEYPNGIPIQRTQSFGGGTGDCLDSKAIDSNENVVHAPAVLGKQHNRQKRMATKTSVSIWIQTTGKRSGLALGAIIRYSISSPECSHFKMGLSEWYIR